MQDALQSLHRIGDATRRTSSSSLTARVRKFAQTLKERRAFDYEGIDLLAVKGMYPDIPPSLAEQLAESVSFRRARLEFQRTRQKKLETRRPSATRTSEPTQDTRHGPTAAPTLPSKDKAVDKVSHSVASTAHGPPPTATQTDVTPFDSQQFQQNLDAEEQLTKTAHLSGPVTVSGVGYTNPYPRLPTGPQCNWCFRDHHVVRESSGWKQKWKYVFGHLCTPRMCITKNFS
jgi:hypothetical protein